MVPKRNNTTNKLRLTYTKSSSIFLCLVTIPRSTYNRKRATAEGFGHDRIIIVRCALI